MKKATLTALICLLLCLHMCAMCSCASALTNSTYSLEYETFTAEDGSTQVQITGVTSQTKTSYTVPATLDGYPVTTIGYGAFKDCTSATKVTLPASITTLSMYSFAYMDALTTINLPEKLTAIPEKCFYASFYNTDAVISLTFPASLTSIGKEAFDATYIDHIYLADTCPAFTLSVFSSWQTPTFHCTLGSESSLYLGTLGQPFYDGETQYQMLTLEDGSSAIMLGRLPSALNTSTSYTVPDSINGYPVTKLKGTFSGFTALTSVTLPNSITSLDDSTFTSCSSLAGITLPPALTHIGYQTFLGCSALTQISLPDSVAEIEQNAFSGCSSLTSIDLSGVAELHGVAGMFSGCRALTSVVLPDTLTSISSSAFSNCVKLTDINVPSALTSIGEMAFRYAYSLENFPLPQTLTRIEMYTFESVPLKNVTLPPALTYIGVQGLSSASFAEFVLPDTLTTLSNYALRSCTNLPAYIPLPASVTTLGQYVLPETSMFAVEAGSAQEELLIAKGYDYALIEGDFILSTSRELLSYTGTSSYVVVPDDVTAIADGAFKNNTTINRVILPDTVTAIGANVFDGCTNLYWMDLPDNMTSISTDAFANSNVRVGCNQGSVTEETLLAAGITPCVYYVDESAPYLTLLTYDELLIATSFDGSVTEVVVPDGVTDLDMDLFRDSAITSVTLPSSIEYISSCAFFNCASLTSVVFPETVVSENGLYIDAGVFCQCTALTRIILPDNVSGFGEGVFDGCSATLYCTADSTTAQALDALGISHFTPIDESAYPYLTFDNMTITAFDGSVTEVVIPNGVTKIADGVFRDCTQITYVHLPNTLQYIGDYAFYGCTGLTSFSHDLPPAPASLLSETETETNWEDVYLDLPETLISIGAHAFENSAIAGTLRVPFYPVLESVGDYAFAGCKNLYYAELPSIEYVGEGAFAGSGLRYIYLYVATVSEGAFEDCSALQEAYLYAATEHIGAEAFMNCSALHTIKFGDMLASIGDNAFAGCTSLTSVSLPNSLTEVGAGAFSAMPAETVLILSDNLSVLSADSFGSAQLACSTGSAAAAKLDALGMAYIAIPSAPGMTITYSNGQIVLVKYDFAAGDAVVIPDGVNFINSDVFGDMGITSVTFPESLTAIGSGAFRNCPSLTSVIFPANLTHLQSYAFSSCTGLTEITLPDGFKSIGSGAFSGCTALASISLPDGMTEVGSNAFRNCTALTEITLPEGVTSVPASTFINCTSLSSVTLPDSITTIGSDCFNNCDALTFISIPEGVTTLGSMSFYDCDSLLDFGFPSTLRTINQGAFRSCDALESVYLPDGMFHIFNYAFEGCVSLSEIRLPQSLMALSDFALANCTALTTLRLPDSLTTLGETALQNCPAALYCTEDSATAAKLDEYGTAYTALPASDTLTIEPINGYIAVTGFDGSVTEVIVPEGVQMIWEGAFANCTEITSVSLPESLLAIAPGAFYNCQSLTAIELPASAIYYGQSAFAMSGITEIVLPEGTTVIPPALFGGCAALTSVTLPSTIEEIESYAFTECTALYGITLPDNVTSIEETAFENCPAVLYCTKGSITAQTLDALYIDHAEPVTCLTLETVDGMLTVTGFDGSVTEVVIPNGVQAIADGVFRDCTDIVYVHMSNTLLSIGDYAFAGCTALEGFSYDMPPVQVALSARSSGFTSVLPETLTHLGSHVFEGCTMLSRVDMRDNASITEIPPYTFSGCTSLANVRLNDNGSLESIGSYAFSGCSFSEFEIPSSVSSIGSYAFSGSSLSTLNIQESLVSVGSYAFKDCVYLESIQYCSLPAELGQGAFSGCVSLKGISLNDSMTSLASELFSGCTALSSLHIPESVTSIGSSVFEGSSVQSLLLPDNITSVQSDSFGSTAVICLEGTVTEETLLAAGIVPTVVPSCYSLEMIDGQLSITGFDGSMNEVIIPDVVTAIADSAFANCTGITSVSIPASVQIIGAKAFNGCTALTSVSIDEGVTYIGNYAFENCTALTEFVMPNSVVQTGSGILRYCSALTDVTLSSSLDQLYGSMFAYCTSLTHVTLPESITCIRGSAFSGSGIESIVVPSNVTSVGASAFASCYALHSVALPDNLQSIDRSAFSDCSALTSLSIPDTVTSIGDYAFSGAALTGALDLPDSLISLGNYAFKGCSDLTGDLVIPDGVTTLGSYAFQGCTGFTGTLVLPSSLTVIGDYTFQNCTGFTGTLVLPNNLTAIGSYAFDFCEGLTGLVLNEGLTTLGTYAFGHCTGITSTIVIPTSMTEIGERAFSGCRSISGVILHDGVTRLGKYAFTGCYGITSLILPDSIVTIEESAIRNCDGLTSIQLPANLTALPANLFYSCDNLVSVLLPDNITSANANTFANCSATVFCTEGSTTAATLDAMGIAHSALPTADGLTIEAVNGAITVTACDPAATEITIPDTVSAIGAGAFKDCTALTEITLPDSITSVGEGAFDGCSATIYVNLLTMTGKTLTNAGVAFTYLPMTTGGMTIEYVNNAVTVTAFDDSVTVVTVPEGVEVINARVFKGSSITSIALPDGLQTIGQAAFSQCFALTDIAIPDSVTEIQISVFSECTALESIVIPESITLLDSYLFKDCTALKNVTIPDSVTELDYQVFMNCTALESIVLPENVDYLPDSAFEGCTALKNVFMPGVQSIQSAAFKGCSALETLDLPEDLTFVYNFVFSGCTSLKQLVLPDGLTGFDNYFSSYKLPTVLYAKAGTTTAATLDAAGIAYTVIPEAEGLTIDPVDGVMTVTACDPAATEISIPEGVTAIGEGAFAECTALEAITLPEGLTSIGAGTFLNCSALKELHIPDNCATIGKGAFANCSAVLYANCYSPAALAIANSSIFADTTVSFIDTGSQLVMTAYETDGVRTFDVYGCSDTLTHIALPEGTTGIGYQAFKDHTLLEEVILPESLTSIGKEAFTGCTALKELHIPDGVRYVSSYAFDLTVTTLYANRNSSAALALNDPEWGGVYRFCDPEYPLLKLLAYETDGVRTFAIADCDPSAVSITEFPEGTTAIRSSAFYGCSALTQVILPESITEIGDQAFSGTALKMLLLPNEIVSVGTYFASGTALYCHEGTTTAATLDTAGVAYTAIPAALTAEMIDGALTITVCDPAATEITIPEGVTAIGPGAFAACENLSSITLSDDLTSIAPDAFHANTLILCHAGTATEDALIAADIRFITAAPGLTLALVDGEVTVTAFDGSVTEVAIPEGVTAIADRVFYKCAQMTSVTFPSTLKSIGKMAFWECSGITGELNLPQSVTAIGNSAFFNCTGITSVVMPDNLTTLGNSPFCTFQPTFYCTLGSYTARAYFNPAYCEASGEYFYQFIDPAQPDWAWSYDNEGHLYAEQYMGDETEVTLLDGVYGVAAELFGENNSVISVTLPESVRVVERYALNSMGIKNVYLPDSITAWAASAVGDFLESFTATLHCAAGSATMQALAATETSCPIANPETPDWLWRFNSQRLQLVYRYLGAETDVVIPEGIHGVGYDAFSGRTDITSVTLPQGATIIGSGAFKNCTALTSFTLPEDLQEIAADTFNGCSLLASINIPQSVTTIGARAFYGCSQLAEVDLPDGLITIGSEAFRDCIQFKNVTLPDSVTTVGSDAYYGISSLSLHAPDTITTWGKTVVSSFTSSIYCTTGSTTALAISVNDDTGFIDPATPDYRWQHIDGTADMELLRYYGEDEMLILPDCIAKLGGTSFSGTSSLAALIIPENVTIAESNTFMNNANLRSVFLPDGMTSVDAYAFSFMSSRDDAKLYANSGTTTAATLEAQGIAYTDLNTLGLVLNWDNGWPEVTGYDGVTENIEIPYGTTVIHDSAFYGASALLSVSIPDSVNRIGEHAFSGCENLTTVNLPASLTSLGAYAFNGCSALTGSIAIPEGVTEIGMGVFSSCGNVNNFFLHDGITSIEPYAFIYGPTMRYHCSLGSSTAYALCASNPNIAFFDSTQRYWLWRYDTEGRQVAAQYIGSGMYADVPEGTEVIGSNALANTSVTTVTIPEGVTEIGSNAFLTCTSLEQITLPDSLTTIGDSAFRGCSRLAQITLPENLTAIGRGAFRGCEVLTEITIPTGVTTLEDDLFFDCYALKHVYLHDGITSVGGSVFANANDVVIYCSRGSNTAYALCAANEQNAFCDPTQPGFLWRYDEDGTMSLEAYIGGETNVTIPDGPQRIGSHAFDMHNNYGLESVIIPEGVTVIGQGAFYGCSALRSVSLPQSLTTIEDQAFIYCPVETVNIPANVTSIGQRAFSDYCGPEEIALPDGITSMVDYVFGDKTLTFLCSIDSDTAYTVCAASPRYLVRDPANADWTVRHESDGGMKLMTYHGTDASVTIPGRITVIGGAFIGNTALESVIIPESVTEIGNSFANCPSLTSVSIPSSLTTIGNNAFYGCTSLNALYLPGGIAVLGVYPFERTTALYCAADSTTARTLSAFDDPNNTWHPYYPFSDPSIPNWTWHYENDLLCIAAYTGTDTMVTLPAMAQGILSGAFSGTAITTVTIPEQITELPSGAFSGCQNLTSVLIPAHVTSIADDAFDLTTATVYCYMNTEAEAWANRTGRLIVYLDDIAVGDLVILTGPDTSDPMNCFFKVGDVYEWRSDFSVNLIPPEGCTFVCESSDPAIANVEGDTVTFLAPGTVDLVVYLAEAPDSLFVYTVNVYSTVESFTLPNYVFFKPGDAASTFRVESITPESANPYFTLTVAGSTTGWTHMDEGFTVYPASSAGIQIATVSSMTGAKKTIRLVTYETVGRVITAAPSRALKAGEIFQPTIRVQVDNTYITNEPYLYTLSSSDETVARPTADGKLQAIGTGTAEITVTSLGGNTATFSIVCYGAASGFALPAAARQIEAEAFAGVPLKAVSIPDGCTSIGSQAFAGCSMLRVVDMTDSVTSIASDAFSGCSNLIVVAPEGSAAQTFAQENGFTFMKAE